MTVPSNTPGTYCSFRNKRNCVGGVVDSFTRTRVRFGKLEIVTIYVCAHHDKTAKRPPTA